MTSPSFFQFESDFVASLRCIPMQVRLKLDTAGVKLKLPHWHQFSDQERQNLVQQPCSNSTEAEVYRNHVQQLVTHYSGAPAKLLPIDPAPPWQATTAVPAAVIAQAAAVGQNLSPVQWQQLSDLQRFALVKLSQSNHENRNFELALQEFGLTLPSELE